MIRIGITMGDPSGIGPEIIAKALPSITPLGQVVVIGDAWVFGRVCSFVHVPHETSFDFVEMANVPRKGFRFGRTDKAYGKASLQYVDEALALLDRGLIDCLVTCPVSKEAVSLWRRGFSGHTEYLAGQAGVSRTVMMLLNRRLKFGLVTTHIPISRVASKITAGKIRDTVTLTADSLRDLFGISHPSIAVAGLNPHASDNGVIGSEEGRLIAPALKKIRRAGFTLAGPLPADTCCARALAGDFDAVVAMYHDQALIPLKTTDPLGGVNLTLGLPYVRTSPLHGTAFDIAGKGKAYPDSLIAAVRTAHKCSQLLKKG